LFDASLRSQVVWFWLGESMSALYWFGFSGVREFDSAGDGLTPEGIFLFMVKLSGFLFAWEWFDSYQHFWIDAPKQKLHHILKKVGSFV